MGMHNMQQQQPYAHAYGYDLPEVVHIQPVHLQKALPAQPAMQMQMPLLGQVQEEKPAKRMKTSLGGLVSRYLGGGPAVSAC